MDTLRAFGVSLLLALVAAGARGAEPPNYPRIADEHIIPAYEVLAQATAGLNEQATAFCTRPDAAALRSLREHFHDAMDAWQSIQHIRFGPVEFLMRNYRYELWPDKRGTVGKHLRRLLAAQDPAALDPERFAAGSVAVQGFSALERLLFGPDVSPGAFATGEGARYRCAVVQAITGNLAHMSTGLLHDWTQGEESHRNYFATAARGNAYYEDDRDLSARLLNSLYTQLQVAVDQKLDLPLGESPEQARPKRAESWRSERSLRNIRLNLLGTRALYRIAFAARLDDKALDRDVESAFEATLRALDAIPMPLARAVNDAAGRAALESLRAEANKLKALFANPVPQSLNLPLGFNSLDGD